MPHGQDTDLFMRIIFFLILHCLFLFPKICFAHTSERKIYTVLANSLTDWGNIQMLTLSEKDFLVLENNRPSPIFQLFHFKQKKNKKLTAALLAFPLPFGIVGLHRIYLGCPPYVPVVYIASFGGVLGLLPLIDFCFILLDKNTETFITNKKVFMWVN